MNKKIFIVIRILIVLVVLAAASFAAFRIGYVRGAADSPALAEQMQSWQSGKGDFRGPPAFQGFEGPRFSRYNMHRGFDFHPLGLLVGFGLTVLFIGAVVRMIFFRRMACCGGWHGHMHMHPCTCEQQPSPQAPPQPEPPKDEVK